jgi:hypothetical protein
MSEGAGKVSKKKVREQNVAADKKWEKYKMQPFALNERRIATEDGIQDAQGEDYRYNLERQHIARWNDKDPEDTRLAVINDLLSQGAPQTAVTPYGLLQAPPDIVDIAVKKKEKEVSNRLLSLAALAKSDKDPLSSAYIDEIFPELNAIPEQEHR